MKNKEILKITAGVIVSGIITLGLVVPVFAESNTQDSSVKTAASSSKIIKEKKNSAKKESKTVTGANTEIEKRVSDIGKLSDKISSMKNLSDSDKTSLSASLQTELANLSALKDKIATDTDPATLKSDVKAITAENRIYGLFIPKTNIIASSDKALTTVNMLSAMSPKLQARIDAVKVAGKDVTTIQTAFDDFNSKIADAKNLIASTVSGITSLSPDNGNKTVAANNKTALDVARKNLKMVETDLKSAQKDIKTIVGKVKGIGEVKENPMSSTSTETQSATTSVNQ